MQCGSQLLWLQSSSQVLHTTGDLHGHLLQQHHAAGQKIKLHSKYRPVDSDHDCALPKLLELGQEQ